jgi:hypothetical protein
MTNIFLKYIISHFNNDFFSLFLSLSFSLSLFLSLHLNSILQRESKDIVTVTSIRERVLQLLNIRLSDKDIVILMSRFDRESNGQVDLVDILGNAKLYYARILQEQKIQDNTNQLKMKYEEFARKQRIARMEEKTVINNILSSKIRELEGISGGGGGESEIQNFSYLNLIKEP